MENSIIIELAVMGATATPLPYALQAEGVQWSGAPVHYWRIRYMERGEEADQECTLATTQEMARVALNFMLSDETVVWRYYETGIEG